MTNNPEQLESRDSQEANKSPENADRGRETSQEARDQQDYQAAGILEEPKNGSFISSLQLFVAWVKSQID
jgi:hypothetical protein